jgi:predicted transposase YbfD/YdcC
VIDTTLCSLTAEELLRRARLEWAVETMHWLLDVHFSEDFCRIEGRERATKPEHCP